MFTQHIESIKKTCSCLEKDPHAGSTMGQLVCSGLNELASRAEEFDSLIASGMSYKKHFLELLTSLHEGMPAGIVPKGFADTQALVMELFEDLTVFVRVRELKQGRDNLSKVETAILKHFESCGQWLKDDNSMVSRSYWYELPLLSRAGS